jgi:hypothetical protein
MTKHVANIDVSALAKRLDNDELFGLHDWRKEKYPHSGMKDIWVRYNDYLNMGKNFNDEHTSVWYPILKEMPEALLVCMELMSIVSGERLGGVLITKIPPGGDIKPHVDNGWHAEYYEKYYVPIKNEKGAKFHFEDAVLEPKQGEVWNFDNSKLHWVTNDSSENRIAMIICIRTFERSISELK